jgi:hypothetical protein
VPPRFRSVAALLAIALVLPAFFRLKAEAAGSERSGGSRSWESRSLRPRDLDESRSFRLQAEGHLRVSGTRFLNPDGSVFQWRGITAFRLLEFVAHGREAEADAYLAWTAAKKLTVVRVLAMADGIFQLSPRDGERVLPRLLEMANRHGIYVEVVALTGTAVAKVDIPRFVRAIGAICARHPNALLELANEPGHPTQSAVVHDPVYMRSLLKLVPKRVPTALGSVEYDDRFAAGQYVTWHAPRTRDWPEEIAKGAALVAKFKKPVISDEPIGAADTAVPERRDANPEHFRRAGAASRRAGLGATFHSDGGVQANSPASTHGWRVLRRFRLAGIEVARSCAIVGPGVSVNRER